MAAPINLYTSNNLIYQGESTEFGAQTVPGGMICVGAVGIGGYGFTKWAVSPPADSAGNATIMDTGPILFSPGTYYLVAVPTLDGFVCDTTQRSNQITFIIRPPVLMGVTINAMSWLSPHIPYSQIVYSVTFSTSGKVSIYINGGLENTIDAVVGTYKWTTSSTYPTDTVAKLCIGTTCRTLDAYTPVPTTFSSITVPDSISVIIGYNEVIGAVCTDTSGRVMDCPSIKIVMSNSGIVSLSDSGILTGIKVGTSTLVCYVGTVPSNTCTVTVTGLPSIPPVCTPSYVGVCRQPLNGYEYDVNNCPGSVDKLNSICNSGTGTGTGTGGTTAKLCASDEMSIFGSCQKKNTVYLIGIGVFALMMMK